MALDPKKRQKKLAKRKAQRKEKAKTIVVKQQQKLAYEANRFALAAHYPVHQCMANITMFAGGIGTVILSRRAPNGDIVVAMFLLDTYCLGVKSALARVMGPYDYDEMISEIRSNELMQAVEPSYARKVVESAVAYAANLGFKPDSSYQSAKDLFGEIDADECTDPMTFGKDGKPCYVSGPMDSPLKRQQIVATLEKNCGAGNFDYLAHTNGLRDDFDEFDKDNEFNDFDELEFNDDEENEGLQSLVRRRE